MSEFKQLVVWRACTLGGASIKEFEEFFLNEGFRIKYETEFKEGDGGINDILFYICTEDIPRFAMFRLTCADMLWWEDYIDNFGEHIPPTIIKRYNVKLSL